MKAAFCLCFDKLNMTEGKLNMTEDWQPELSLP
jgi:hypothetical protein